VDELMEIGRFAEASGLSIDALRHYDDIDLLTPASGDPRTSYRRYGAGQLRSARLICNLRGVDLPVDEVRAVLEAGDDPEQVQQILRRHQTRLAERAGALEKMMATAEAFTDQGVPVPRPNGARVVQVVVASRDHDESVRFYSEVFGLAYNDDISSFVLGAWQADSFFLLTVENWLEDGTPSAFGLLVDDVDRRHARAIEYGATQVAPPTDYGWKPRSSVVDDPSGNRIQLSQG
jgi:DNA-binding transcriptional MerR regulator